MHVLVCADIPNLHIPQVFVTSKLSPREHGYAAAIEACHAALSRLKTGYLDLLLIHWPGASHDAAASPSPPAPPASAPAHQHADKQPLPAGSHVAAADALRRDTWRALEHLHDRFAVEPLAFGLQGVVLSV